MAYLDTLTSHNTQLQGLINKANALPNAGSGGGGSLATCTVTTVNNAECSWVGGAPCECLYIYATVLNDAGNMEPFHYCQEQLGEVTIPNVVCGCAFIVYPIYGYAVSCTCENSTIVVVDEWGNEPWVFQPNGDDTITFES